MNTRTCVCLALLLLLGAPPALADRAHAQNEKAKRLYKQEQYDKALEVYDQAILESPQEHGLHANRASTLHRLGRFDESVSSGEQALQSDKRALRADVHYNRGNALYRQGEQQMASGDSAPRGTGAGPPPGLVRKAQ